MRKGDKAKAHVPSRNLVNRGPGSLPLPPVREQNILLGKICNLLVDLARLRLEEVRVILKTMDFQDLYRGVFAILRIENTGAKIAGTGFVIGTNPVRILTCHHVVSEGTVDNNGRIKYSITKRTDAFEDFDIRQGEISLLRATRITYRPEFDLAILEIDPNENTEIAERLGIQNVQVLDFSFDPAERIFGEPVQWMTTAVSVGRDLSLTPRFFRGNIVTNYLANHGYAFKDSAGTDVQQQINGARLIEVDNLFVPGCSGGPILNTASGRVIGYVHGFKSWPVETNTEITQKVKITDESTSEDLKLTSKNLMTASLSLGIDVRTIEEYLRTENLI